jgi:hypothetical protein
MSAVNEEGPRGSYGCACVSRDARECALMRYGHGCDEQSGYYETCDCMCHQWDDDEDAQWDAPPSEQP